MQVIHIDITLDGVHRLQDSFQWDLCNPDNSEEEFAASLVADFAAERPSLTQNGAQLLEKRVALEIRRQLDQSCLHLANKTKSRLESLVAIHQAQASSTTVTAAFDGSNRPEMHFTSEKLMRFVQEASLKA